MIYIVMNAVPILAAALAGLAVGWAFHRGTWRSPGFLLAAFVAEAWFAAILAGALILAPADKADPWIMAIGSAVVIWIGFVVPVLIVTLRRAAPREIAHWFTLMVVQAVVLKSIGVVPPPV